MEKRGGKKIGPKEPLPNQKATIEVVYAGGTISSLATPDDYREGGHVMDLVGKLERITPDFNKRFHLGQTQVAYIGLSENIDEHYWKNIEICSSQALYRNTKAIVITHGTDSMEQTARRLQRKLKELLEAKRTKIILTGANEDVSHPKTDAWENLTFAFERAQSDAEPAVYVAFHQRLVHADLVVKEPYNGVQMNYVSREDKEYVDGVAQLQAQDDEIIKQLEQAIGQPSMPESVVEYPVNIVRSNHDEFLSLIESGSIKAILLKLYHSGTANTENPILSVSDLVRRFREERRILFFGVTENGEAVDLHSYETSAKLREAGVIPLYNMRERVALAKLRSLVRNDRADELIDMMLQNIVGEIDVKRINTGDIAKLKAFYRN